MKTIFYIESKDEKGDYWFENKPYKQVLSYDNIIYQCDGNVRKIIEIKTQESSELKNAIVRQVKDTFYKDEIVRRIALGIH